MKTSLIIAAAVFLTLAGAASHCSESPGEGAERKATVYLENGDHVAGSGLVMDEEKVAIKPPYADLLSLERDVVRGIAWQLGMAKDIATNPAGKDTVLTTKAEKLSGTIISIDETGLKLKPFFAPENVSAIPLDKIVYCVLKKEKRESVEKKGLVKIVFVNGDLLTGNITEFSDGKFKFKPLVGSAFSFGIDKYQAIHNAEASKLFVEGGLAGALIEILKKSGNVRSYGGQIFPILIRGFVKVGDMDGATFLFEHLSEFSIQPYIYQQIGDEFMRGNMNDLAIKAYKVVLESDQRRYYYVHDKLLTLLEKQGRKAEAASICEQALKEKDLLSRYGKNPVDIHLKAAGLYMGLKNFSKAAEHLQAVIVDPTAKEHHKRTARDKLIGMYKDQGELGKLITRYEERLSEQEKVIGQGMLLLISRYIDQGKLTKARLEFNRLERYGLEEYQTQAKKLIDEFENR